MGKQEPSNTQRNTTFPKHESTITLKVLIHCEGCKRKVKRIIKCVDGVDSVNIEAENGKVTVVGSGVDAREVLSSLHKAGKHAEIWQFGGAKLPNANQSTSMPRSADTGEKKNMKAVGFEKMQQNNSPKEKGSDGGVSAEMGGAHKAKGGDMIELANANPIGVAPKSPFPMGGFPPTGHFDKPNLPVNNVAILSKSVAPRPSIFHGETSFSPLDNSESATVEYATHLFSDENTNSCSVM